LKGEHDEPSIGLILCKTNNKIVAEYALRDTSKPIGIAEYKIAERLPDNIKGELPSIEEIEQRVDEEIKAQSPVDTRLQIIKEKIKNINKEEIQTPATFELLSQLYKNGLRKLYTELIEQMNVFKEDFYSTSFNWNCPNKNFTTIEQVDEFWEVEENLRSIFDFTFHLRLNGFKKTGTEYSDVSHRLIFKTDTYFYSLTIVNYNNQQPILKKLYHQQLSPSDRKEISDVLMTVIMDDIERILGSINPEKI